MSRPLKTLVACLWICGVIPKVSAAADRPHPLARAIVVQEKYCLGQPGGILNELSNMEREPPEAITLRLLVELSFRNAGAKLLIAPRVYKVSALIISRTSDNVVRDRTQLIVPFESPKPSEEELEDAATEPNDAFELIPPGAFANKGLSLMRNVFVRVHDPTSSEERRQLLGKRIFLQLELAPLQIPKPIANEVTRRWSNGYLWNGKVRTNPVEIDIPVSPEFADCSNLYKID